ncbi:uncharacterized protein LOC119542478 isoform X6 [Choloepus didactylus]|uniref:uncharacterized protein LOC119542478 isoform X6 n=1 Tax=Choloepus didactylus TaxID=27675 RepID=UPI0018A07C8D|nr:uncharacterized protein LOC119542478 isoform X6 [Choloepus didactylus]
MTSGPTHGGAWAETPTVVLLAEMTRSRTGCSVLPTGQGGWGAAPTPSGTPSQGTNLEAHLGADTGPAGASRAEAGAETTANATAQGLGMGPSPQRLPTGPPRTWQCFLPGWRTDLGSAPRNSLSPRGSPTSQFLQTSPHGPVGTSLVLHTRWGIPGEAWAHPPRAPMHGPRGAHSHPHTPTRRGERPRSAVLCHPAATV